MWQSFEIRFYLKKVCHHRSCKIVNSNTLHLNTSDLETAYAVNSVIRQWNLILVRFSWGVVSEALSQMLHLWNISMSFRSVSSQEAPKSHKDSCKNLINPIHRTYDTCGSVMLEHFRKRNVPRNLSDTNWFLIPVHVHITLHYETTKTHTHKENPTPKTSFHSVQWSPTQKFATDLADNSNSNALENETKLTYFHPSETGKMIFHGSLAQLEQLKCCTDMTFMLQLFFTTLCCSSFQSSYQPSSKGCSSTKSWNHHADAYVHIWS